MWWGIIGGVVLAGLGVALVVYGRRFPPKKSFVGRTGIPVPPAPWDQRRTLMGSGIMLALIGVVLTFVFFMSST